MIEIDPNSLGTTDSVGRETDSAGRIEEILDSMMELLLYKNKMYGDSALNPRKVFYKGNSTNSILIRLDDKISRIQNNKRDIPRVNDVCDIIGYCTLLLISMGVTGDEIKGLMD